MTQRLPVDIHIRSVKSQRVNYLNNCKFDINIPLYLFRIVFFKTELFGSGDILKHFPYLNRKVIMDCKDDSLSRVTQNASIQKPPRLFSSSWIYCVLPLKGCS